LGVNNLYLTKTRHKLALKHNDRSPLENLHCCICYDVLSQTDCNIFESLTSEQASELRKIVLMCILGTDMQKHFDNVKRLEVS
jgi:high affinity cGMP-specific 3',5'-cyclic phosphodiesterase 9